MDRLQEEVSLLSSIPIFAHLEPTRLKLLAFTSQRLNYQSGDALFHQGDQADAAYVVIDGTADVIVHTPKGDIIVASLGRNDVVGEIGILCDVPRTATVMAKTNLTTLCISKDLFLKLLHEFPSMSLDIMRELAHRLEQTTSKYQQAMSELAKAKSS